MKKILACLIMVSLLLGLSGCGDTNFFSWVHKSGSDDSQSALKADGEKALIDKDYSRAEEYFTKVLESNPKDSVARYGRAQAAYGAAGISLSKILSSALEDLKDNSISSPYLDPHLTSCYDLAKRSQSAAPDNLIPISIDLQKLYSANAGVILDLKYIADGNADGVIPYDDPDVNINLAIAMTLQAALFVLDSDGDGNVDDDSDDIIQVNDNYEITINGDGTVPDAQKTSVKNQAKRALIYVVGDTKAETITGETLDSDNPAENDYYKYSLLGAVGYLDQAMNSADIPKTGILNDLKNSFNDLSDNLDSGTKDLKWLWEQASA